MLVDKLNKHIIESYTQCFNENIDDLASINCTCKCTLEIFLLSILNSYSQSHIDSKETGSFELNIACCLSTSHWLSSIKQLCENLDFFTSAFQTDHRFLIYLGLTTELLNFIKQWDFLWARSQMVHWRSLRLLGKDSLLPMNFS